MTSRGALLSALSVVLAAVGGILYTVLAGNSPLLGLDLQGGVSVVLEPTAESEVAISDESLDLTVELLRSRIDQIGVAEPEISRQGNNIVVALPGVVEDQKQALERLQQTAELRFRPVIGDLGPSLTDADGNPIDLAELQSELLTDPAESDATDPGDTESDTTDSDTTDSDTTDEGTESSGSDGGTASTDTTDSDEESLGPIGRFSPALPAQSDESSTTSTTAGSTESSAVEDDGSSPATVDETADQPTFETTTSEVPAVGDQTTLTPAQMAAFEACSIAGTTPDDDDAAEDYVVLADANGNRVCLGPTLLTGEIVETANVALAFGGVGWEVNPVLQPGANGIDKFNDVAGLCFNADPDVCPTRRLAVVLDHNVISSPSINAERFSRDQIVISGDFQEEEARLLAESLRFGALPLELVAQETRTVSATIGHDVLEAGMISGLIGLVVVAIYLLAYYRLAGLVAISGLVLSAALLWTIVAWFGETYGLALSLAGVVGLIVSVGVSADSNIVYFENVKDAYMSGRRVPTAVERAYRSSISTIIKADVVSLIAAVLLYLLTVGAVRGFAFYLGLATILDLVISLMFMRPALAWLARRSAVEANPRILGLPKFQGGTP